MKFFTEYLGYIAGICTTLAFIPQVIKVWKSKNVDGVSLSMFIIFIIGVTCWLVYGIILNQMPLIIANFITLVLALFIIIAVIKFKKKN